MAAGRIGGRIGRQSGQCECQEDAGQGQEDEQDLAPGKVRRERFERRACVIDPPEVSRSLLLDPPPDRIEPRLGSDRVARKLRMLELNMQLASDRWLGCEDGRGTG